jgi:hypothetical protein
VGTIHKKLICFGKKTLHNQTVCILGEQAASRDRCVPSLFSKYGSLSWSVQSSLSFVGRDATRIFGRLRTVAMLCLTRYPLPHAALLRAPRATRASRTEQRRSGGASSSAMFMLAFMLALSTGKRFFYPRLAHFHFHHLVSSEHT